MMRIRIRSGSEAGIFEEVRKAVKSLTDHNISTHDGETEEDGSAVIEVDDDQRDSALFILRRVGIHASKFEAKKNKRRSPRRPSPPRT